MSDLLQAQRPSLRKMIFILPIMILAGSCLLPPSFAAKADPEDDFVRAYFLIQKGEADLKLGKKESGQRQCLEARKILTALSQLMPSWDPKLVAHYQEKCDLLLTAPTPLEELPPPSKDKLIPPPLPGLREYEFVSESPREIELRMAQIEEELQRRKQIGTQRMNEILEENRKLKDQSERADRELTATQKLLEQLQKDKNIGGDLLQKFQKDLEGVKKKLHDLDLVTARRVEDLTYENQALKTGDLLSQSELIKAWAMLDAKERDAQSWKNPIRPNDESRLESLEAENKILKEILSSIEKNLNKTRSLMNPLPNEGSDSEASFLPPIIGRVSLIKPDEGFILVHFYDKDRIPLNAELGVYRDGRPVGTIRVTKPVRPPLGSCTILTGKPQLNDLVR